MSKPKRPDTPSRIGGSTKKLHLPGGVHEVKEAEDLDQLIMEFTGGPADNMQFNLADDNDLPENLWIGFMPEPGAVSANWVDALPGVARYGRHGTLPPRAGLTKQPILHYVWMESRRPAIDSYRTISVSDIAAAELKPEEKVAIAQVRNALNYAWLENLELTDEETEYMTNRYGPPAEEEE